MKNILSISVLIIALKVSVFAQSVLVVDQYGGGQYITINAALTAAVAGDTIKVMPGLYQEQINLAKKIHFLAMDTTAILDYQTNYTFYFNTGSSGSSLQGFNIRKPLTAASGVKEILIASNIFDSTTVSLNLGAGSTYFMNNLLRNTPLTATNSSEKIIILNNRFNNTSTTATLLSISGGNVIVANNEFNGGGTAISTGSNTNIIGNVITNANSKGIYFSQSGNIRITSNKIISIGQTGIHAVYQQAASYQIYTNIYISNNLLKGISGTACILFEGQSLGIYVKTINSRINNNIFANSVRGFYIVNSWTSNTLFDIKNNIFAHNTNEAVTTNYGIMSTDFNCTFSNGNNNLSGVGNLLNANPLFVDATNGNYNLQSSSPCKNTGSPIPQDYDLDRSRNDMGIYGGSYNWDNFNSATGNARVLELLLSPVATAQGNTITITGSGIGNKQSSGSLENSENKNIKSK